VKSSLLRTLLIVQVALNTVASLTYNRTNFSNKHNTKEKCMVFKKLTEWQELDKENRYFSFIESCRHKKYGLEDGECHLHHIIPQYAFKDSPEDLAYCNSAENTIVLSCADHLRAHELLYSVFQNKQDLGAVKMLQGAVKESRRLWRQLGAAATHQIQKEKNQTFYNSEFQKEMARRSLALPNATENRSRGGKLGGVVRNLDKAIQANQRYVFSYQKNEVLCVFNCRTGGEVLKQLHSFKKTPLKRVTPLLKGERKTLNGWSCKLLES
jgi:hypothetical protein